MNADQRSRTRDAILAEWNAILDGRRRDPEADRICDLLWRWDDRHRIQLRGLIPRIVDSVLSRLNEEV